MRVREERSGGERERDVKVKKRSARENRGGHICRFMGRIIKPDLIRPLRPKLDILSVSCVFPTSMNSLAL